MANPRAPRHREYWHAANVIFPRRTIFGKWVHGGCYARDVKSSYARMDDFSGHSMEEVVWNKEYATAHEVFLHKLKVPK